MSHCEVCENQSVCKKCVNEYFLIGNECESNFPFVFWINNNSACHITDCVSCKSPTECKQCKVGLYWDGTKCSSKISFWFYSLNEKI